MTINQLGVVLGRPLSDCEAHALRPALLHQTTFERDSTANAEAFVRCCTAVQVLERFSPLRTYNFRPARMMHPEP